jgi:hypothetical protein
MKSRAMEKIQVFLRQDQKAALKSLAKRLGLRQSDLVRRGVDLVIDKARRDDDAWREATREAAGLWRDRANIDDVSRDLRQRVGARFSHGAKHA